METVFHYLSNEAANKAAETVRNLDEEQLKALFATIRFDLKVVAKMFDEKYQEQSVGMNADPTPMLAWAQNAIEKILLAGVLSDALSRPDDYKQRVDPEGYLEDVRRSMGYYDDELPAPPAEVNL
jgi:hypothetical protein